MPPIERRLVFAPPVALLLQQPAVCLPPLAQEWQGLRIMERRSLWSDAGRREMTALDFYIGMLEFAAQKGGHLPVLTQKVTCWPIGACEQNRLNRAFLRTKSRASTGGGFELP